MNTHHTFNSTSPLSKRCVHHDGTGASCLSNPAQQAEKLMAEMFDRIASGTTKIAGFQTSSGRHLAVDRQVSGIQVWTESLPGAPNLGVVQRYPTSRPRHSNLTAQAPRVATGREALVWKFATIGDLQRMLAWYTRS